MSLSERRSTLTNFDLPETKLSISSRIATSVLKHFFPNSKHKVDGIWCYVLNSVIVVAFSVSFGLILNSMLNSCTLQSTTYDPSMEISIVENSMSQSGVQYCYSKIMKSVVQTTTLNYTEYKHLYNLTDDITDDQVRQNINNIRVTSSIVQVWRTCSLPMKPKTDICKRVGQVNYYKINAPVVLPELPFENLDDTYSYFGGQNSTTSKNHIPSCFNALPSGSGGNGYGDDDSNSNPSSLNTNDVIIVYYLSCVPTSVAIINSLNYSAYAVVCAILFYCLIRICLLKGSLGAIFIYNNWGALFGGEEEPIFSKITQVGVMAKEVEMHNVNIKNDDIP